MTTDARSSLVGLGLDAGGSGIRWLLADGAGGELGRGTTTSTGEHLLDGRALANNRRHLEALLSDVLKVARPEAAVAGMTGVNPATPGARELERVLARALGLAEGAVSVVDDMRIAYAAAFEPGEGVLVYAGTGSIAYHLTRAGEVVRSGGHGYLIDDAGAGFWIGKQGLKQTLRWRDEGVELSNKLLARSIFRALGSECWEEISAEVYGGGRPRVAALAPAVGRAAHEGDEAARTILQRAGEELARLAELVARRLPGSVPVAFAGGISSLSPLLTGSLRNALPDGTLYRPVTREPVEAAAYLASRLARELAGR